MLMFDLVGLGCELVVGRVADDRISALRKRKRGEGELDLDAVLALLGEDAWYACDNLVHFSGPLEDCVLSSRDSSQVITPERLSADEILRHAERLITPVDLDERYPHVARHGTPEYLRYIFVGVSFNKGYHGAVRVPDPFVPSLLVLVTASPEYGEEFNLVCGVAYDGEVLGLDDAESNTRGTESYFWIYDRYADEKIWRA